MNTPCLNCTEQNLEDLRSVAQNKMSTSEFISKWVNTPLQNQLEKELKKFNERIAKEYNESKLIKVQLYKLAYPECRSKQHINNCAKAFFPRG